MCRLLRWLWFLLRPPVVEEAEGIEELLPFIGEDEFSLFGDM